MGMRTSYAPENKYDIDQEETIREILKDIGLEKARGVRTPIGEVVNENNLMDKKLLLNDRDGKITV